jgi:hypothetical protein
MAKKSSKQNLSNVMRLMVALTLCIVLFPSAASAQLVPNLGGQRAGISAFQFLKIGVGGRGVALGESFVALANDASALYWNPAGLTQFSENQVFATHTDYLVDIRHQFLGIVYHLSRTDHVGASVTSLHMDDMEITTETQPFGTGKYFKFGDLAVALSYARRMTDQFSFGITARYVEETLDVLKMRGLLVDIGTYYWTGIGSTRFAVVVSNFGANVAPKGEVTLLGGETRNSFQSFSPPTLFKIGFAMEAFENQEYRVTTSIQLNHPNDNVENIRTGIEYEWNKTLFARIGVKRTIGAPLFGEDGTSEDDVSLGVGFSVPVALTRVTADYAFTNYNRLGGTHRFSLGFTF